MPAFYRTSSDYTEEIVFPANPGDNDTFLHPGGWLYQYSANTNSWGLIGSRGVEGPPGPEGIQGEQGPQGTKGPTGDKGNIGDTGPVGPTGAVGDVQLVTSIPETTIRGAMYLTISDMFAIGI